MSIEVKLRLANLLMTFGKRQEAVSCLAEDQKTKTTSTIPSAKNLEWINSVELLHPGRMDVMAKYLYARDLLNLPILHSGISSEDIYLKHILFRTGGAEPGDEARKGNLKDFKQQFAALLHSMKQSGFDVNHPIPVSRRTGLILNGAHRLAAACALGIKQVPIIYHDDVDGLRWDSEWFIKQGFLAVEIHEIVRAWIMLRAEKAGCIILWPPVESHWAEIIEHIQAVTPIVASFTIDLPQHAFFELVRDIYASDWGPVPGENIERKITFFNRFRSRLKFLVVATKTAQELISLKKEIRQKMNHIIPIDYFSTLHTTDTVRETAYIADILLSQANLAALLYRPSAGFRTDYLIWLKQYLEALQKLCLDPNMCCVVGSGVLEAFNIRAATDIDFTLTHELREKYFTPGVTHLTPDLDVVARDYPRALLRSSAPTDNDLIHDRALHIYVRGLKFASLDMVLTRKQAQRRPKDLTDIELASRQRLHNYPVY